MEELEIPLWLKLGYTLMVAVIVPAYWKSWGPKNFLWLSDIALFGLLFALWLENSMIASVMIVMTLLVEIAWALDLIISLIFGKSVFNLTAYMFENKQPLGIRLLSLFHLPMLAVMLYFLFKSGYRSEAIYYAMPLSVVVFICTRLARPEENINWVYGFTDNRLIPKKIYFPLLLIVYPVFIILPTHFLLSFFT